MIKLIEGDEFWYDFDKHSLEILDKVEFDERFYSGTQTEKPDWIKISGTIACGTIPLKKDQKTAMLAVQCKSKKGYMIPYIFHFEIVAQEEYDRDQIDLHIARCQEPLEEFEHKYPEAFQEWIGEFVFC